MTAIGLRARAAGVATPVKLAGSREDSLKHEAPAPRLTAGALRAHKPAHDDGFDDGWLRHRDLHLQLADRSWLAPSYS
ncbi:MAG: hypothetical protein IPL88_13775 [Rhizobiales bacterium]|nr:hypothetical protein [Hyphomicrobiales bacterium]